MEELLILEDNTCGCVVLENNIGANLLEMIKTFSENTPYSEVKTTSGICYKWNEDFINKCKIAMATDNLLGFSDEELRVWNAFVYFESNQINEKDFVVSLDKFLTEELNCQEHTSCSEIEYTLVDVSTCTIN